MTQTGVGLDAKVHHIDWVITANVSEECSAETSVILYQAKWRYIP